MRGYLITADSKPVTGVTENTLVGCKRCYSTWYEMHTFYHNLRINSAMQIYDCCDNCKKEGDDIIHEAGVPGRWG